MAFVAGLDLGKWQDFTAFAVVEVQQTPPYDDVIEVRRWPLGTKYEAIVADVAAVLSRAPLCVPLVANPLVATRTPLVVDAGGVGVGVVEMLQRAQVSPLIAVALHGGHTTHRKPPRAGAPPEWAVAKKDLIAAAQLPSQNRTLRLAPGITEREALVHELETYVLKINPATAHESFLAERQGDHDDLVCSVALAMWWKTEGGKRKAGTWPRGRP